MFLVWLKLLGLLFLAVFCSCTETEKSYQSADAIFRSIEENKSFTNLLNSDDNLPIPAQRLLILPEMTSEGDLELISDPLLKSFKSILSYYHSFEIDIAQTTLRELEKSDSNRSSFPFEYQYIKSILEPTPLEDVLKFISETSIEKISKVDLYYLLKCMMIVADRCINEEQLPLGLSIYQNGIFIFETDERANSFPKLKAEYYLKKGLNLFSEADQFKSTIASSLKIAKKQYLNLNELDYINYIDWHLSDKLIEDAIKIPASSIINMNLTPRDKVSLSTDIGAELEYQDVQLAIDYFEQSNAILSKAKCYVLKNYNQLYLAGVYLSSGNLHKANQLYEQAADTTGCTKKKSQSIRFYNIILKKYFYPELIKGHTKKFTYNKLLEERAIALDIYATASDHFYDYLTFSTSSFVELYLNDILTDTSQIKELITLIDQTKIREIKLKRSIDIKTERSAGNVPKMKLLRELNEFRDTSGFDNPAYVELFQLIANEYISEAEMPKKEEAIPHPGEALDKIINYSNMQMVEYIAYDSTYLGYYYSKEGLLFFDIDYDQLVDGMNELAKGLKSKTSVTGTCNKLKQLLLPDAKVNSQNPIFINPDGLLSAAPFQLILGDSLKVNYTTGLQDLVNRGPKHIDKSKTKIFSYTDYTTINDYKTVKDIRDLRSGYMECLDVMEKLNLSLDQFFSGKEFTAPVFLNNLDADLVHVSSHASSDLKNRLDNYIVVRNAQGRKDSLYSYELEVKGISPKVVMLSACDTGIGAFQNGTGTYSVSRAFAANGALAIVKTLWEVNDIATRVYMGTLYDYWVSGSSLGEAMDKTRQHLSQELNVPAINWAGFVLEGNPNIYLK